MGNHSPVGASGMPRWGNCPGAVAMSQQYDTGESSQQAEEGTAVHDLSEYCFNRQVNPGRYLGCEVNDIELTEEMIDAAEGYLTVINGLSAFADLSYCEREITDPNNDLIRGTVDHIAITGRVANITDLKFGRVFVPATTPQLKYYAGLVREEFGAFDWYVLGIYQPRVFGSTAFRTITISDVELVKWIYEVQIPAISAALKANAQRNPGEWCRYCPGKLHCPEFKAVVTTQQGDLSNDELARIVSIKKSANAMFEDAEKEAVKRLQQGEQLPGLKLIQRKGRGYIKDEQKFIESMLANGYSLDDVNSTKLKGVTDLRKLAPKLTDEFIIRDDGKPGVAKLDDPAPAVSSLSTQFGKP